MSAQQCVSPAAAQKISQYDFITVACCSSEEVTLHIEERVAYTPNTCLAPHKVCCISALKLGIRRRCSPLS